MSKMSMESVWSCWVNFLKKCKNQFQMRKKSFKYKLITAFGIVSIIPIIVMQMVSYYNTVAIIQSNVDELVDINLVQTQKSIKTMLSSYEDLLYQMYTDDYIVELVDKISTNQNVEVSSNQLRRTLRGLANVKPYVQSITVIIDNGETVFYDKLTASTIKNAWMDTIGIDQKQLYKEVVETNDSTIISTRFASQFSAQPYYLFHIAHRIIDYRNIMKKNGIIILSIDEKLLNEVCNEDLNTKKNGKRGSLNFIVDREGKFVSFIDRTKIGTTVVDFTSSQQEQQNRYKRLIKENGLLTGEHITVHSLRDKDLGWSIVNVADQSEMFQRISDQQKVTVLVIIFSVLALIIVIVFITNHLTSSIGKVVKAMKVAGKGELSVRIKEDSRMSIEIVTIVEQFNRMMSKISDLIKEVKTATVKQKNAEIAALEAQINPHFLYNTLDTINWMAIDQEQYEISNTINSLAKILRYGVDKSNSIVEIRKEVEWLKQYIFLQQTRLKNTFECKMHIDPNVLGFRIHKLLFQPFVENAILHAFEGVKRKHEMVITMKEKQNTIEIVIKDNGKGMSREMIEKLNAGFGAEIGGESRIGINNAVGRLKMYYCDKAQMYIESKLDEGTTIFIEIPKI